MDYMEVMEALEQEGFLWHRLREYFPFGAIELGEGRYQALVTACLDRLPNEMVRERLLDLLDMQAAIFLEQCWAQDELGAASVGSNLSNRSDELGRFGMAAHFAAAWLQINSNLRRQTAVGGMNLMRVLRGLQEGGSLAQRLTASTISPRGVE